VYLPGGGVLMWGEASGVSGGGTKTVTFPGGGFPINCFNVVLTAQGQNQTLAVTAINALQFSALVGTSGNFYWSAIGH
jgi:hypothetical protein